jgi:hypothetical protein
MKTSLLLFSVPEWAQWLASSSGRFNTGERAHGVHCGPFRVWTTWSREEFLAPARSQTRARSYTDWAIAAPSESREWKKNWYGCEMAENRCWAKGTVYRIVALSKGRFHRKEWMEVIGVLTEPIEGREKSGETVKRLYLAMGVKPQLSRPEVFLRPSCYYCEPYKFCDTRSLCVGGFEYLHRSLTIRTRWRKRNPVPG